MNHPVHANEKGVCGGGSDFQKIVSVEVREEGGTTQRFRAKDEGREMSDGEAENSFFRRTNT